MYSAAAPYPKTTVLVGALALLSPFTAETN